MTGAQEALPATGPANRTVNRTAAAPSIAPPVAPPAADAWGSRGSGGFPQAASPAYPDQWYGNPRLNNQPLNNQPLNNQPLNNQPRPGGSRFDGPPAGARPADPRLEGINYGELRYDEPDPLTPGQPGHDEPLDDESWYEELRREAPAYPQNFGPQHPSGPHRRMEPQAPPTASSPASRRRLIGRPATASRAATGEGLRRRLPRAPR